MKFIISVVALIAVVVEISAAPLTDALAEEWNAFKLEYGKNYESESEEEFRMKVFFTNLDKIEKHNQQFDLGLVSFRMDLNSYADLLHSEFVEMFSAEQPTQELLKLHQTTKMKSVETDLINLLQEDLPETVDWRLKGAVTPIRNQGKCNSCWAFTAAAAVESHHFIKTGELVEFSPQYLIDCMGIGCKAGGKTYEAFLFIGDMGGIATAESYPYLAEDDICKTTNVTIGAKVDGFVAVAQRDEKILKRVIATVGPVTVAIDVAHESFHFYKTGIYYEKKCSSNGRLGHAVLVVGYGTDEQGHDYWLVKNSWGTLWGENGYARMARNKDNNCGIASFPIYPLVLS